jgi:hypothetical protein
MLRTLDVRPEERACLVKLGVGGGLAAVSTILWEAEFVAALRDGFLNIPLKVKHSWQHEGVRSRYHLHTVGCDGLSWFSRWPFPV